MKTSSFAVVFCVVTALSAPTVVPGQDTSTASLLRRVEQLEKTNANLERRVRELEAFLSRNPASAAASAPTTLNSNKSRELANWRRLKVGMSMEDVRQILGEPERIDGGGVATWHWDTGRVTFINEKLTAWFEPMR
jgi:hypothetical protein